MLPKLMGLAAAGAAGTLLRYWLSGAAQRLFDGDFPWGTAVVNGLGCFLAGLFWSLAEGRLNISGEMRTVVMIGFMGAFTTFSTFALETGALARDSQWLWAAGNVALHNGAGILLLFIGAAAGRMI